MLDIHTHILPGMDDGSRSAAQSVLMLEREAAQGVHAVALTPHYQAGREAPESFLERRELSAKQLLGEIGDQAGYPRLLLGAETAYFDGMSRCEEIDSLCIGDTRSMLIEMPFCRWNERMRRELIELRSLRGIQPVLAHVERYFPYQGSGIVEQLAECGMLIQVNTSFILRWQTALKAMRMLKRGCIHFIASDCHDLEYRIPNLGLAAERIQRRLGAKAIDFLKENEERLLNG